MEAKELRVGNWCEKTEIRYSGMKKEYMQIKINDLVHADFLDPIPLTEEWLLKIGFKKIGGELWDCNQVRGLFKDGEFTPLAYLTPKKYLHEIQNLYFALTGKELSLTKQ